MGGLPISPVLFRAVATLICTRILFSLSAAACDADFLIIIVVVNSN